MVMVLLTFLRIVSLRMILEVVGQAGLTTRLLDRVEPKLHAFVKKCNLLQTMKIKMKQPIRNFIVAVAFIILAGCNMSTDHVSPSVDEPNPGPTVAFSISYEGASKASFSEVTGDIYIAGKAAKKLLYRYRAGDITAKELSDSANELIASNSGHSALRHVVPQLVSHVTLSALLENEEVDGLEPYVAHHTKMLVDNDSPQADIIARALDVLDGYWSDNDIQAVAEKAIVNAESYLNMSLGHMQDKSSGDIDREREGIPVEKLDRSQSNNNIEIGSGIESLERLFEE